MTTMTLPAGSRPATLTLVTLWLRKRRTQVLGFLALLVRLICTIGALAAFTLAAWGVDWRLGLVVAGICALLLEWVVKR